MSHKRNQLEEPEEKNSSKSGKCEHRLRTSRCRDCGGNALCVHFRRKHTCKECGGSLICVHFRRKSSCIECGGSLICVHNRNKSSCIECGGSSICVHNHNVEVVSLTGYNENSRYRISDSLTTYTDYEYRLRELIEN